LINRYIFSDTLDEPLWSESSGGTITYLNGDETGSIILTTNSSGGIVSQTVYDPFGGSSSVNSTNFGFTGQRFDPETGLYFCKARHYSPSIGRFLQPDPIGYDGGDLNLYGYVNNDPLNSFDPLGLTGGVGNGGGGGGYQSLEPVYDYTYTPSASSSGQPASTPLQGYVGMQDNVANVAGDVNPVLQAVLDFSRGGANVIDFGIGNQFLNYAGQQGVNLNSVGYISGEVVATTVSVGRTAYATTAKLLPLINGIRPATATLEEALTVAAQRNTLKRIFRLGLFPNARMHTAEQIIKKYGGNPQLIIEAAQRTNKPLNEFWSAVLLHRINNSKSN
jgi:RHS repeat-associated protein